MNGARWQGFDTVIFDCDSTLTQVEGIDELARLKGKSAEVAALTRQAMDGATPLQDVYRVRLAMLNPTRAELAAVAEQYIAAAVADARETVAALRAAGREVYIVSAGLEPPVAAFAAWLGVDAAHVRAVRPQFAPRACSHEQAAAYGGHPEELLTGFDETPLVRQTGKAELIAALPKRGRSLLVGDGMNDCAARESVDLFIGFGGVARREAVECAADVYLTASTVAGVLPFALRPDELPALDDAARAVLARGLAALRGGQAKGALAQRALDVFVSVRGR